MSDDFQIDGLSVRLAECWWAEDLTPLLSGSSKRGQDRDVPGQNGVIANPRRDTVTRVDLRLTVMGMRGPTGLAHTNSRAGLGLNAAHLQQSFTKTPATDAGTRTGTLTIGGLPALERRVHIVDDLDLTGYGPHAMRGILRLSFPDGLFDLTEWLP